MLLRCWLVECFVCFAWFQIPNPLFDLAGITCGHFLVPFSTFFGATLIGKAVIKMHIQVLCNNFTTNTTVATITTITTVKHIFAAS